MGLKLSDFLNESNIKLSKQQVRNALLDYCDEVYRETTILDTIVKSTIENSWTISSDNFEHDFSRNKGEQIESFIFKSMNKNCNVINCFDGLDTSQESMVIAA